MSAPQYNPQQVRFVQNAQVESSESIEQFRVCYVKQVGGQHTDPVTITSVKQLSLVDIDVQAKNKPKKVFAHEDNLVKDVFGVTQTSIEAIDSSNPSEQIASDKNRMVPVATSGLLLVEMNTSHADAPLSVGDTLSVDAEGRASKLGKKDNDTPSSDERVKSAPVKVYGTSPIVKEVVSMGDKSYVLVDFI